MRWSVRAARQPFTSCRLLEAMVYGAIAAAIALMVSAIPAGAQDIGSQDTGTRDSQAKTWNLTNEEKARFDARVVDILCELSGDCPANCGDGNRQLGLLRTDGTLVLVFKNVQPIFSGAVEDLLPYCGKEVEVDGLFAAFDDAPAKAYQVQLIREKGDETFSRTNRWTKVWNAANPDLAKVKGPWFRKEPRINALIARDGYLGLGPDVDRELDE